MNADLHDRLGPTQLLGRQGILRDVMAQALKTACDLSGEGVADWPACVSVLVEPDEQHWLQAQELRVPVVLVAAWPLREDEAVAAVLRGADTIVAIEGNGLVMALEAIRQVRDGATVLPPHVVRALARAARSRHVDGAEPPIRLTARETEILQHIDRGCSVKQTARSLGISAKTVENLQSRLFRKLRARNRAQAVRRGHDLGLIGTDGHPTA